MKTIQAISTIQSIGSEFLEETGGSGLGSVLALEATEAPVLALASVAATPIASLSIAGSDATASVAVDASDGTMIPIQPGGAQSYELPHSNVNVDPVRTREQQVSFLNGLNPDGSLVTDTTLSFWTQPSWGMTAHKWGTATAGTGATITYKFNPASAFTDQEKATFLDAFAMWSAVANVTFVEDATSGAVTLTRGGAGTGAFENDNATNGSGFTLGTPTSGNISIATTTVGFDLSGSFTTVGGYGMSTVIHEVGHLLGLGHGGYYNGSANQTTQQFSAWDERQWTIMSYLWYGKSGGAPKYLPDYTVTGTDWGRTDNGSGGDGGFERQASHTMMQLDIEAIQQLYGASTSGPFTGGQTYGFNNNITGRLARFYDFTQNTRPVVTLFNSGLNNTLDVSGFTTDSTVDLTPGAFSSVGSDYLDARLINNLSIAANTRIDNAITGNGADDITGNNFANSIQSGGDNDTVHAGAGNDTVRGGLGSDTLDGGANTDVADYSERTGAVLVELDGATPVIVIVGNVIEDEISNFEWVFGGSGGDSLEGDNLANKFLGNAGNDVLKGGLGIDTLDGGANTDTADYSDKTQKVEVALNGAASVRVFVNGIAEDWILNVENLTGGTAGDKFTGDGLANKFLGNEGNDSFKGGLGIDTMDGGLGAADTADYSDKINSVEVALNGGGSVRVKVGGVAEDWILSVENLTGGSAGDKFTGDLLANKFLGNAGNDVLKGGLGIDTLDGGANIDTADYSDKTNSVEIVLNGTTSVRAKVGGVNEDWVLNVEQVIGGSAGDRLTGDSGANRFWGNNGNDTFNGGLGADIFDGGAGADRFQFKTALGGGNIDTVVLFEINSDRIELDDAIFGGIGPLGALALAAFHSAAGATSGHDLSDRIIYNSTTGGVFWDADGNQVGGVAAIQFATLTNKPIGLDNLDFAIV